MNKYTHVYQCWGTASYWVVKWEVFNNKLSSDSPPTLFDGWIQHDNYEGSRVSIVLLRHTLLLRITGSCYVLQQSYKTGSNRTFPDDGDNIFHFIVLLWRQTIIVSLLSVSVQNYLIFPYMFGRLLAAIMEIARTRDNDICVGLFKEVPYWEIDSFNNS